MLTFQATVAAGTGVDATAFVDRVELLNAATGQVVASAVPNASFETSDALFYGTHGYAPTGATWVFASNSGIAANGSPFNSPSAPDGSRVAFLQTISSGAGSFGQTLPALAAGAYQVRVQLAQRPGNTTAQGVRVLVDGSVLGTFTPGSSTGFGSYVSTTFVVDAVLRLEALGSVSQGLATDVTAFVDEVELLNVEAGTSVSVPNAGFETSGALSSGTHGYTPSGATWAFASNSGIAANGSGFNNPTAPAGTRVAFLQTLSSGHGYFSQVLPTALPTGSYRVRLYGAQRATAPADQVVRVLLNGQEVGRFQPTTAGFVQYTLPSATSAVALSSPPTLTAVSPAIGGPSTVLSLTGTNLAGATSITFAGAAGQKVVTSGFTVNAAGTSITGVVVPAGAQSGPVTVTTAGGGASAAAGGVFFTRVISLEGGLFHTASVRADGTLWTWGFNQFNQLGDGTTTNRLDPVQIGTATTWVSTAAGYYHTAAVRADGTLWAWGRNNNGQVGDGTTTPRNSPVQVGTATNWVSVAAGANHTAAVRADGTLWAWGNNGDGQLGDGTTTQRNSPVQVGTATTWVSVTAGLFHTVAVRADGTLWAWGDNIYGQLGDGTTTPRNSPGQVGTATTWVSAAAGITYAVAVRADGTLWAWGSNGDGQLGDGTITQRNSPVQVGTATTWVSAAGGNAHTVAVRADGTLWAWGRNSNGQLGDGTTTQRNSPGQVGTATTWVSASAGGGHSLGEQSCRAAWAWGSNTYGQLGDGTTTQRNSPVLAFSGVSLTGFSPASAGAGASVAVTGTGLLGLSSLAVNGASALASVTNLTDTGFSFVVPAGATAGSGTVAVAGNCGSASSAAFAVSEPLPVTLVAFRAQAHGRAAVRLSWATANEVNSARFEVERSADGVAFAKVGEVAAAGTTATAHTYALLDAALPAGAPVLYYRLRQVDLDGTATYSPVRAVALGEGVSLYPNPTTGAATLSGLAASTPVQVFDALGRVVATATADASGTAQLAAGLPAGVYVVRAGAQALRLAVE